MPSEKPSVEKVLHALGDPTRRAMVEMLSERPHSVSRLAEPFGITLTAVMQHLQILQDSGLVRTEKLGRVRTASLETGRLWTYWSNGSANAGRLGSSALDRLGELLADEKPDNCWAPMLCANNKPGRLCPGCLFAQVRDMASSF